MHGTTNIKFSEFLTSLALGHVGGRLLLRYSDLYQKLQLQFYVLLMMFAMDTHETGRVILQ